MESGRLQSSSFPFVARVVLRHWYSKRICVVVFGVFFLSFFLSFSLSVSYLLFLNVPFGHWGLLTYGSIRRH